MTITSETYEVDDQAVTAHRVQANGEDITLLRPTGAEPEVLIGGSAGYSLDGARRLRDALAELIWIADSTA